MFPKCPYLLCFFYEILKCMMIPGIFGDAYSLQIAANILVRDIILLPTKSEFVHHTHGYILIESYTYNSNPVIF